MGSTFDGNQREALLLPARLLFSLLFIIFGWQKLIGFSGTVAYMTSTGLPAPSLAAAVAIVAELGFGLAIAAGIWTRPVAVLTALYALATAFIGHRYWMMTGMEHYENMVNFYKNVSIMGGSLLLCVTGPGRYSLDSAMNRAGPIPWR
jgi:putative oxidoreductase